MDWRFPAFEVGKAEAASPSGLIDALAALISTLLGQETIELE
jgi:hypothetical protein